jgi:hypothetical protein
MKLEFRAFGGSKIDPDSVVVTYLKDPAIDITQRITPFISTAASLSRRLTFHPASMNFGCN